MKAKVKTLWEWVNNSAKAKLVIVLATVAVCAIGIKKLIEYCKLDDTVVRYLTLYISEKPVEAFVLGLLIAGLIGYAAGRHDGERS
ncbi:MAG: hypothetical protein K2H53_05800 [Clostridia bacterium]|nr:hypothetical protein [Clostridia bacterium]